ncbi:MAG: hypothetical protein IKU97_06085, partial [Tidjanibacter sp.]|nr:hypothetical protein [Tidjanibacter sp.]
MVEIKTHLRLWAVMVTMLCISLTCSAQQIFVERQLKQLALRGERVEKQLAATREALVAAPSDSLAMVVFELEKQAEAIAAAIETLSAQQAKEE